MNIKLNADEFDIATIFISTTYKHAIFFSLPSFFRKSLSEYLVRKVTEFGLSSPKFHQASPYVFTGTYPTALTDISSSTISQSGYYVSAGSACLSFNVDFQVQLSGFTIYYQPN